MTEEEIAERFGQDIDVLLRQAEPSEWDAAPPAYHRSLDLARALAASDHSNESQQRYAVRQRLIATAEKSWDREAQGGRDGFWGHPLVALPLALVTLVLMCTLILPSYAGWGRIGQPELPLSAIETPVAAAQTAYAGLRSFNASAPPLAAPTSAPLPTNAAPTPTQALTNQPLPAHIFVATGTPSRPLSPISAEMFGK